MEVAMKFVFALIGFLALVNAAQAQSLTFPNTVLPSGGTTYSSGTAVVTLCLSTTMRDDCVKSDLVITSHDKTILLRGVYGCKDVASKMNSSTDVTHAECFR
jgi:hypothetical protein